MPQVLIRDVSPEVLDRLKTRAKVKGRSLQAELRDVLVQAAGMTVEEARAASAGLRAELSARKTYTATDYVRDDRDREH